MFDSLQMLKYRANAGITQAQDELNSRLNDRMELPLPGLHGEKLFLTGVAALREKAAGVLQRFESAARAVLNGLVHKGYLDVNTSQVPFIYRLQQHIPVWCQQPPL